MTWLLRILIWPLLAMAAWTIGLVWFAMQIPPNTSNPLNEADVIVILTGGAGRLDYGLSLLADHKGKALFISGVSKGVTVVDIIRQASPEIKNKLRKEQAAAIFLGDRAENTIGNAEETRRWLEKRSYTTMLLVTSNYHMPRSLSEFKELMPEIAIIPAPVIASEFTTSGWLANRESRRIILSEYHKYLASKLRHWFVSATRPA